LLEGGVLPGHVYTDAHRPGRGTVGRGHLPQAVDQVIGLSFQVLHRCRQFRQHRHHDQVAAVIDEDGIGPDAPLGPFHGAVMPVAPVGAELDRVWQAWRIPPDHRLDEVLRNLPGSRGLLRDHEPEASIRRAECDSPGALRDHSPPVFQGKHQACIGEIQISAAAHELTAVAVEDQAIDGTQIGLPSGFSRAEQVPLPAYLLFHGGDALAGLGMIAEDGRCVTVAVQRRRRRFVRAGELGEQPERIDGAVRFVTGADQVADREAVGLQFLFAHAPLDHGAGEGTGHFA